MKRSESMLVYGVTAILVVIVGFAVIFGDESKAAPGEPGQGEQNKVAALFQDEDPNQVPGFEEDPDAESKDKRKEGTGGDDPGPAGEDEVEEKPITIADLGRSEILNTKFDGRKHREVVIQQGDTFKELVQRWAPGFSSDDVLALNETLDISAPLPVNTTLLMPYVDDARILDAHIARLETNGPRRLQVPLRSDAPRGPAAVVQKRGDSNGGGSTNVIANDQDKGATAPKTSSSGLKRGDTYVVKDGQALWTIAAKVVGGGKALEYCEDIKRANGLSSNTIRPGMKLKLP